MLKYLSILAFVFAASGAAAESLQTSQTCDEVGCHYHKSLASATESYGFKCEDDRAIILLACNVRGGKCTISGGSTSKTCDCDGAVGDNVRAGITCPLPD